MGILIRQGIVALLFPLWNGTVFVLKDKVGASDNHTLAIDLADDAVGNDILHLRVHLFVIQSPFPCGLDDCIGHGMREMFFQAGGQAQHIRLVLPAEGNDLRNHRAGVGQGAGFVKDHRIRLSNCFQILAALYRHMEAAGLPHGGEDSQGHCQLQGTGEVHHENRQGAGDIPGQQISEQTTRQSIRHQPVRQIGRAAFRCGFQGLRLFDHRHDLVIPAAA